MTRRAKITAGLAGLAAAAAIAAPLGIGPLRLSQGGGGIDVFVGSTPTPTGVTCNQTISTRAAVLTALTTAANGGQTICVTADITGAAISTSTDMTTSPMTLIAQPDDMTINMVPLDLSGANRITVQGFDFDGSTFAAPANAIAMTTSSGGNTGTVVVKKSYFHNIAGNSGIYINDNDSGAATVSNVTVLGNRFYRISCMDSFASNIGSCSANFPHGYGVYTTGGVVTNFTLSYNTIENGGDSGGGIVKSADGAELNDLSGFTIDHNVFKNIRYANEVDAGCVDDHSGTSCDPHVDTLGIFFSDGPGSIHDNRLVDGPDFGVTPDGQSYDFTNNLVVDLNGANGCQDSHYSPGQPINWNYTRNTYWVCGGDGLRFQASGNAGSGDTADHNLISGLTECNTPAWSANSSNVLGTTLGCWAGATNTASFTPTWGSTGTANWDNANYYIATNLPGGTGSAGYTYVAAGYTNCGC